MLVFRGIRGFPSCTTDGMAVSSPGLSVPHVPQSPFETDTSHPSPPPASSPGWADFPPQFGDDTPQFSATNSAMSPVRAHSSLCLAVLAVGSRIERLKLSKRHEGETVSHRRFNSSQCRYRGCICRTRYIVSTRAANDIKCACDTMLQRYNVASLIVAPPKPFWQILPSAELTSHENNTQPMHSCTLRDSSQTQSRLCGVTFLQASHGSACMSGHIFVKNPRVLLNSWNICRNIDSWCTKYIPITFRTTFKLI